MGILGVVVGRRQIARRVAAFGIAIGFVATVAIYGTEPARPAPPSYSITVGLHGGSVRVSSPVRVLVCGRDTNGGSTVVPGDGNLVEIWMDGRTVAEGPSPVFAVPADPGTHELQAEIVPSTRIEYVPPLRSVQLTVTVAPSAPPSVPLLTCPT